MELTSHILTQEGNPETLDILIFDCCRGNIKKELGEADEDTMEVDAEELSNSYYKNVIIIRSTLPDQVN